MWLDGQGARNQYPLFLPPRQGPKRLLSQISKTHLLQTVRGQLALLSANRLQQCQPPIGAHEHYLEDCQGKDRIKRILLGNIPRGAGGAIEAVCNLTGKDWNKSEYASQQGRLASAIWPHQGKAFTTFNRK
jgi:hypothetical protein